MKTLSEKPPVNTEYLKGYNDGRRHRDKQFKEHINRVLKKLRKLSYDVKTNKYRFIALYEFDDLFKEEFGKLVE